MNSRMFCASAVAVLTILATLTSLSMPLEYAHSEETTGKAKKVTQEKQYTPEIASASDDGALAISKFQMPENFKASLFAAEPKLANPVTFCIDEQGRFYVAETFRQARGVEDNRRHMYWLEDEYQLQTVKEREAMIKKHLPNEWKSYTKHHERIRLITDTDGDGKADTSTVYADGFNAIVDGTGAGLLARKGDLYYTCIPHLWKLTDKNNDGVSDSRTSLHNGYGVRFSFRGHDMHGLIVGPDGRVYFSIGDRGYNVHTADGKIIKRVDTGAVFRCNLDGTHLEEFAFGLRNPQELAFDDFGNLFTGDNNSDLGSEKARWVYVCQDGDSGWRMPYQYFPDRGPWDREGMWRPYHKDKNFDALQPNHIVPPIDNISDGPDGLVAYPGLGLPDRYKGHFFLCDFRATDIRSGVHALAVKTNGAGFDMVDAHHFLWGILSTDVDFGYNGKIYVSDWVNGWFGEGKGRIYEFEDTKELSKPDIAKKTEQAVSIMKAGFEKLPVQKLVELLNFEDRRIRQEAQFELVSRKEINALLEVAKNGRFVLPRLHALWGLGQLARKDATVFDHIIPLLKEADQEIAAQAAKLLADGTLTEKQKLEAEPTLLLLIQTSTARCKYFASIAFGKQQMKIGLPEIIKVLEANNDQDPFLRHGAVMGLVHMNNEALLLKYVEDASPAARRGILLALRRMKSKHVIHFLHDEDRSIVMAAARAINDEPIPLGDIELAALTWKQDDLEPLKARILNANNRQGKKEHAAYILKMIQSGDFPLRLQKEAIVMLLNWAKPLPNDRVTNAWRPLPERKADFLPEQIRPAVKKWLDDQDADKKTAPSLKMLAIQLAAKYQLSDMNDSIAQALNPPKTNAKKVTQEESDVRLAALSALNQLNAPQLVSALPQLLNDPNVSVRSAALSLYAKREPKKAVAVLDKILRTKGLVEKQQAIHILAEMKHASANGILELWCLKLVTGDVELGLQLDIIKAARLSKDKNFIQMADSFLKRLENKNAELGKFALCLEGGDAVPGKELYKRSVKASCRRCHKVQGDGGIVGPDLSIVGKEKSRLYLLEAIILPNKAIAKGFESVIAVMETGKTITGIVKEETDKTLTIQTAQDGKVTIQKEEILVRKKGQSGMPDDLGKKLSLSEIRDIVQFLSLQKTHTKPKLKH